MKRLGWIVCLGMSGFCARAQSPVGKVGSLPASRAGLQMPVHTEIHPTASPFVRTESLPAASPITGATPGRMPFFCRMEQQGVNRTGVRFKIHAGDYEAYSHRK